MKLIVDSAEASFAEFNCSVNHITEISVFCNVEKFTEFSSYNGENIQINVSSIAIFLFMKILCSEANEVTFWFLCQAFICLPYTIGFQQYPLV